MNRSRFISGLRYAAGILLGLTVALGLASWRSSEGIAPSKNSSHAASEGHAEDAAVAADLREQVGALLQKTASGTPLDVAETLHLARLVRLWLKADLVDCLNYLRSAGRMGILDLLDKSVLSDALSRASSGSPAQALGLCSQVLDGTVRDRLLEAAFAMGAEKDVTQLLPLLGRVPHHLSDGIYDRIAKAAAAKGEGGVMEVLRTPGAPLPLLAKVFASLCQSDPAAAARIMATAPELDMTNDPSLARTRRSILFAIFERDRFTMNVPLANRRAFLEAMPEGPDKFLFSNLTLEDMAWEDPDSFYSMLPTFTNPGERESIVRNAFDHVLNARQPGFWRDAAKVAEEMVSPAQRLQKLSIAGGASTWTREVLDGKLPEGLAWAQSLEDPMERAAALNGTMGGWINGAPDKAFAYVAEAYRTGDNPWLNTILPEALANLLTPPPFVPPDSEMQRKFIQDLLARSSKASPADKAVIRAALQPNLSPARWSLIEPLLQ